MTTAITRLGHKARMYYGVIDPDTGVVPDLLDMIELKKVRDVTLGFTVAEADATTRANGGYESTIAAIHGNTITFELTSHTDDVGLQAIHEAYKTGEVIELAAITLDRSLAGAEGPKSRMSITGWDEAQQLKDVIKVKVTAKVETFGCWYLASKAISPSVASILVPEGGTATFTVRLRAKPAAPVTVAVARASGDDGITVTGGAALNFTVDNWLTPQTVTLAAADDDDSGSAVIALSSAGYTTVNVSAKDQGILTSVSELDVPEGGSASVMVSLRAQPAAPVTVAVARDSGDADITIMAGASLVFTPANWGTPQSVTLAAADDDDSGSAVFSLASAGLATEHVTAHDLAE